MQCYVFLGPPGAGKGTMADMLCRERKFAHISTGDILRREMDNSSSLGRQARQYIDNGQLVPDELMAETVSRRIDELESGTPGIVLDGYPRTVPQAELLDDVLRRHQMSLTSVILFEAESETLLKRLTARWLCRRCGAVYNSLFSPPAKSGVCDQCGGELYQRSDDQPDTVRHRLRVYRQQTSPLIDYYEKRSLLKRVSGEGTAAENYAALLEVL